MFGLNFMGEKLHVVHVISADCIVYDIIVNINHNSMTTMSC